ncbi:MAG: hypothetical protein DCC52_19675, partial [Chloroflexi bacterium]
GGKIPAKALALLIYLAVTARPHSREHLANLLWGQESETKAQASLRQALSKLKPIADEFLISEKATVAFDTSKTYWLDVEELTADSKRQTANDAVRRPVPALRHEGSAVSLYSGDFLSTLILKNAPEFEVWVLEEREKYRARAAELFARIVQENLDAGNARAALDALNRLIALDAWNENAQQQKMRVLARMGKTKDALAQYQTLKKTLRDDLDIEPSPETTALFEKIRDARSSDVNANAPNSRNGSRNPGRVWLHCSDRAASAKRGSPSQWRKNCAHIFCMAARTFPSKP